MKYLYSFELFLPLKSDAEKEGYDEISQDAFDAIFETQSTNSGSGLYLRKKGESFELVRRNGNDTSPVEGLKDIVWVDGAYLPPRPSEDHEWNGTAWVVDADVEAKIKAQELANLKADLCAKIDGRAIEVGDSTVKSSVYLTIEYQRNASDALTWKDAGYTGEPPEGVLTGAQSRGITAIEEADLILSESNKAEGLISFLRAWRMTAKGVQGIKGATTVEAAQAIYDAAISDLASAMGDGK